MEYRTAVAGHLMKTECGYLLNKNFLKTYEIHKAEFTHMEYLKSDAFWSSYKVPFAQAALDREYLYGLLFGSCRKKPNKIILTNEDDLDGIMTWIQLRRLYDNGGSVKLRVNAIDKDLRKPFSTDYPGGLTGYIEQYQALMAELDALAPSEYPDDRKQRLLVDNLRKVDGMAYMTKHVVMSNLSYDMSADLLVQEAIIIDQDNAETPRRVMNVSGSVEDPWLDMEETFAFFTSFAQATNAFTAYQSFNNRPLRQSLRIPDNIWHALAPALKDEINAVRSKVRAEREAKASPTDGSKPAEGSKPVENGGIPAQYPNMKETNAAANANVNSVANVALANNVKIATLHNLNSRILNCDGDDKTDDGILFSCGYMVETSHEEPVRVHAHFEYATPTTKNYAISDSGADSCCLGKHCHPVSYNWSTCYSGGI
jgi:hypothetical protein